jgi:pyruvate kinase
MATVAAADERDAAAIMVLTSQGVLVSGMLDGNELMLHRGVHPIHVGDELTNTRTAKRGVRAIQYAKQFGIVQEGDNVVVVSRELATESDGLTADFATMKIATVP